MSLVCIPAIDWRDDLCAVAVCVPVAGTGSDQIINISGALAPRGPVNIDLVHTYSRLYRIMTANHLVDTMRIVMSLSDKPSDVICLVLHGQAMRYGYTANPHNPSPNLPLFTTAIYKLTGGIMEWELGAIAYRQGLSMDQTRELYESYRSRQFRKIARRKLSRTI